MKRAAAPSNSLQDAGESGCVWLALADLWPLHTRNGRRERAAWHGIAADRTANCSEV